MATLAEKIAKAKQRQVSAGGLSLSEKIANKKKNVQPTEKIFAGGTFSDILDAISIPQYAITGALSSKKTIREAIKEKYTPKQALGLKGIKGFAADVLLDPLNLLGAGLTAKGLKALKEGKAAATLGGAAKAGQMTALGVGLPFSEKVVSLLPQLVNEKILGGITKGAEALKSVPYVGKILGGLGARKAIGVGRSTDEIESLAKDRETLKAISRSSDVTRRLADETGKIAGVQIDNLIKNVSKKFKMDEKAIRPQLVEAIVKGTSEALPNILKPTYQIAKNITDDLNKKFIEYGGTALDRKVLTNILTKASKETLEESKGFAGSARKFGGQPGVAQFAKNVNFRNQSGDVLFGKMAGKTKAKLIKGKELKTTIQKLPKQITKEALYAPQKVLKEVKEGLIKITKEAQEIAQGKGLKGTELRKEINRIKDEQFAKFLEVLKKKYSKNIFTREAASAQEINIAKQALGETTMFTEDLPPILQAQIRGVGHLKASQDYIKSVKQLGKEFKGKNIPAGFARSTLKDLKGLIFEKPLIEHIDATYKGFSEIKEVNEFVKLYDKLLNFWKGAATYLNPGFHTRNMVSNIWQNYLAGVKNPINYAEAVNIQRKLGALKKGAKLEDILSGKELEYFKGFRDQGVYNIGAFNADFTGEMSKLQDNFAYNLAGAVGAHVENNARLALYIDRIKKGFNPEAAAKEVRKYLFDYSDLTDFEKNVMKRWIPFYSWTRKNIPLQVAMLIQKPARISVIAKAKSSIENAQEGKPMPQEYLPTWLQEAYPIYFGTRANGIQSYLKAEGFIPSVDLDKLKPGGLGQEALNLLTPAIKTPFEVFANYSTFFRRDISDYEGQRKSFLGQQIPAKLQYVLSQIRPLNEINKFFPDKSKKEQLTFQQALTNYIIGKTYNVDPKTQKDVFKYIQAKTLSNLEKDLGKAQKNNNPEEAVRIKALIQNVNKGQGFNL